jgi:hypothetical protein
MSWTVLEFRRKYDAVPNPIFHRIRVSQLPAREDTTGICTLHNWLVCYREQLSFHGSSEFLQLQELPFWNVSLIFGWIWDFPFTFINLDLRKPTTMLTERFDICTAEEDISWHSVHEAAFGHTGFLLAFLPTFMPSNPFEVHTFCFLLWHSTQEVLNFKRPSTNFGVCRRACGLHFFGQREKSPSRSIARLRARSARRCPF